MKELTPAFFKAVVLTQMVINGISFCGCQELDVKSPKSIRVASDGRSLCFTVNLNILMMINQKASNSKSFSFQNYKMDSCDDIVATCAKERIRRRNDELLKKMKKFFKEDCRAFSSNDPGFLALEEAVRNLDVKVNIVI